MRMEYTPTLFFNEFWLLRDHLIPLNETVGEVTLHFSLSGMSQWKWTIFTQMEQSFNMQVGRCTARPTGIVRQCIDFAAPLAKA